MLAMARGNSKSTEHMACQGDGTDSSPPLKRMKTRSPAKASASVEEEGSYASLDFHRARDALCGRLGLHYTQAETCTSRATRSLSIYSIPELSSASTFTEEFQGGKTSERTTKQTSNGVVTEPAREVCPSSINGSARESHVQLSVSDATSESRQVDMSHSTRSVDQCNAASTAQQLVPNVTLITALTAGKGCTDFRTGQELPSSAHVGRLNILGLREHPIALDLRDRTSHSSNPSTSPSISTSLPASSISHQKSTPSENTSSLNPSKEMPRQHASWGLCPQYQSGSIPVQNPSGPVLVQDPSGPVLVQDSSGPVLVQDPSGPVLVQDPSGPVLVQDSSEPVLVEDQFGQVHIQHRSGSGLVQHQSRQVPAEYQPRGTPVTQPANMVYSATINPGQERQLGAGSFINTAFPHEHQQHPVNWNAGAAQSALGISLPERPPQGVEQLLAQYQRKYVKLEIRCDELRKEINGYKPFCQRWNNIDPKLGMSRLDHMKQNYNICANAAKYHINRGKELETIIEQLQADKNTLQNDNTALHAQHIALQEEITRMRDNRQTEFQTTYHQMNGCFAQAFNEQALVINQLRNQLGILPPFDEIQMPLQGPIVIPDDEDEAVVNVMRHEEGTRNDLIAGAGPDMAGCNDAALMFEEHEQGNAELNDMDQEIDGQGEEVSPEELDEFIRQLMESQ